MDYINKRIALKVALIVNVILFAVMCIASIFLIWLQNSHLEEQLRNKGISQSMIGAKTIGQIMEEAIDNGVFLVNDAFDTDYRPIHNFTPPKYHTRYDAYLDKAILGVEDEFLSDESLSYAVAVDINGYLPTHNSRFQKAPTGDVEKDKIENRTKRIFDDPIGLKAAKNLVKGFQQIYQRDTGETLWDFSTPIYVKGKQWGGFRVGISLGSIKKAKLQLTISLILAMFIILCVANATILIYINWALIPLHKLTEFAGAMADGDVGYKIEMNRTDELGDLLKVLNRLHYSIQIAKAKEQVSKSVQPPTK
jgi:methyl-accepting chemotaxis protein